MAFITVLFELDRSLDNKKSSLHSKMFIFVDLKEKISGWNEEVVVETWADLASKEN